MTYKVRIIDNIKTLNNCWFEYFNVPTHREVAVAKLREEENIIIVEDGQYLIFESEEHYLLWAVRYS